MTTHHQTATFQWLAALRHTLSTGSFLSPRGALTIDLPQHTIEVDMRAPVVDAPTRKLSHKFLGAEAHWILSGDNRVETIAPYNKNIAQFSDDGQTFFGAYGPKFVEQLPYVVAKLLEDPSSRQAGLTLWRESPPATKDVPCTIAMFFRISDGKLHCHVFMRSSDLWLGVPYDVFNFSMMALLVCCKLNQGRITRDAGDGELRPGILHVTAASRHVYERNWEQAEAVLASDPWCPKITPMPRAAWTDEEYLMGALDLIRSEVWSPLRWGP